MANTKTAVFGIYHNQNKAERIVDRLLKEGFSNDDISVLLQDNQGSKDFAHEKNTKAPKGTTTGVTAGGVIGGTLGLLAGIGALAIPGSGPFIAAGPIMGALAGLGVGGAVGGLIGALVGMGIPEYEAKRYEGHIKAGGVLLSVHCDTADQITRAKDLLQHTGARDISSSGEASADYTAHSEAQAPRQSGFGPGDEGRSAPGCTLLPAGTKSKSSPSQEVTMAKLFAALGCNLILGTARRTGKGAVTRNILIAASLLLLMCAIATAQTRDPRVDELTKETEQLKRKIADQDRRITELEKAVKSLRATAAPLPTSIPAETPPWYRASNWNLIKTGMSEAQVVGILGPATNVDSSEDRRTLDYTPDSNSMSTLKGSVTLVDDRVTAMTPPAF